ncbi:hypothetical protein K503DRAFT_803874 [Rhizopogon vinicolor AM-OR11-026]|uniref:Uncharacterized protein n=1 Tax=Rhizopogon vinicolor AM-OR11-026 TaxID=1314800 RepID=A0A1B7MNB0_9AGAM|nr:hypothetical protein K503DRAFT_803874 [Rhizopogon vinicolor AM-OR11-026]
MSDIDCAIGPDGHLKDASEIKWIINPDNVASASSTRGKRKAGDSPVTMHRVARRKVIPTFSASSDDGGHVSDIDTAEGADTEADKHASEDDVRDAYASTKAMGDADNESGATHCLKGECTADVHTVFVKKDDYVDPHTGLIESGYVCMGLGEDEIGAGGSSVLIGTSKCFSSSRDPSVWCTIPVLEFLQKTWENMAALPQFSKVRYAIQKALDNVAKWYDKMKDTNTYFICLALNPNVKVTYAEHQWDKNLFNIGLANLEQMFDDYYVPPVSVTVTGMDMEPAPSGQVQYGHSWVLVAVQAHQASDHTQLNPRAELTAYLKSPLA